MRKYVAICLVTTNAISLVSLVILTTVHVRDAPSRKQPNTNEDFHLVVAAMIQEEDKNDQEEDARRLQADLAKLNGTSKKPAAHLTISRHTYSDLVPKLAWQHFPNVTFLNQGMSYEDDAVSVEQGGYYYIYSQIVYTGNGSRELEYGRIIHSVLHQQGPEPSEGASRVLMKNLQSTPSIRRGRQVFISSNLGATFYLKAGARVTVTSSVPGNIDPSPQGTYFGLFLV